MSNFVIGDKVVLIPKNRDEAKRLEDRTAHDLEWTDAMTDAALSNAIFTIEDYLSDENWFSIINNQLMPYVHPTWIRKAEEKPNTVFECTCPTPYGCICGAMENEMAAKNKVKCQFTKLWTKVD